MITSSLMTSSNPLSQLLRTPSALQCHRQQHTTCCAPPSDHNHPHVRWNNNSNQQRLCSLPARTRGIPIKRTHSAEGSSGRVFSTKHRPNLIRSDRLGPASRCCPLTARSKRPLDLRPLRPLSCTCSALLPRCLVMCSLSDCISNSASACKGMPAV